jgi:hypothetical protein
MSHPHLVGPNAIEMAALKRMAHHNDVKVVTATGALPTSGLVHIVSAATTAIAVTLAAPVYGDKVDITLNAIGSAGTFVLTTATGVRLVTAAALDDDKNTATFNAAADRLVLRYLDETHWLIETNTSVTIAKV